jgi:hypothetical protein
MLAIIVPGLVADTFIWNIIPFIAHVSTIFTIFIPHAVPERTTSLNVNVPVLIALENIAVKNTGTFVLGSI